MTTEELRERLDLAMNSKPIFYRVGQFVFNYIDFEFGVADAVKYEDGVDCSYDDAKVEDFIECAARRIKDI